MYELLTFLQILSRNYTICLWVRMNLVETHLWQNDDWKDQYVGVVPRATTGNKVNSTSVLFMFYLT